MSALPIPQLPSISPPGALREHSAWLLWRYEMLPGDKKPRKVPYYTKGSKRSGVQGSDSDRAGLVDFDTALAVLGRKFKGADFRPDDLARPGFNGIGFAMLPDWQLVGLDFDDCVTDGAVHPEVLALIDGTYAELSPSGRGVRAFMTGELVDKKSHAVGGLQFGFETFHAKGFLTITGDVLPGWDLLGLDDYVAPLTDQVVAFCGERFGAVRLTPPKETACATGDVLDMAPALPPLGWSPERLAEVLAAIPYPKGEEDWKEPYWVKVGMACYHEASGDEWGLDAFDAASARGANYAGREVIASKYARWGNGAGPHVTARWLLKEAGLAAAKSKPVLDAKNIMGAAREFSTRHFQGDDGMTLLRAKGLWYEHEGPAYAEKPEESVRAAMWRFLDGALKHGKDGAIDPYMPGKSQVDNVLDALRSDLLVEDVEAPCWLPGCTGPDPRETVSMTNGLLHIPTRALHPHSIGFFTLNTLPFEWDAAAQRTNWLKFLAQVWPDDQQSIDTLQEMFGYLLTADTSQQKMFLILGPKRSGKGTIGRILAALLGRQNVAGPTFTSLTGPFGMEPLIDKLVALMPDARIGPRADTQAIVERLLMVSGEDYLSIDRKHKTSWEGTLPTRFVVLSNETPQLGDSSGAVAGRFIVISMKESFYGREDLGLTSRLLKELPGIFQWALEGRARLRDRGHFVQPESANKNVEELTELSSPILSFVKDCCVLGPELMVKYEVLYAAWRSWCSTVGREHPGTLASFGKMLRAADSHISESRPRAGNPERSRYYTGVALSEHFSADFESLDVGRS